MPPADQRRRRGRSCAPRTRGRASGRGRARQNAAEYPQRRRNEHLSDKSFQSSSSFSADAKSASAASTSHLSVDRQRPICRAPSHQCPDDVLEQLRVRHVTPADRVERLRRIEDGQTPRADQSVGVDAAVCQAGRDSAPVRALRNDEQAIAFCVPLRQDPGHGLCQRFSRIEELNGVLGLYASPNDGFLVGHFPILRNTSYTCDAPAATANAGSRIRNVEPCPWPSLSA